MNEAKQLIVTLRTEGTDLHAREAQSLPMSGEVIDAEQPHSHLFKLRFRTSPDTEAQHSDAQDTLKLLGLRVTSPWSTDGQRHTATVEEFMHDDRGRSIPTLNLLHAVSGHRFRASQVSVQEVKELIAHGADVNAFDDAGEPLLISAGLTQSPDVIEVLLDAGANPDARCHDYGEPILHHLIERDAPYGNIQLLMRTADLEALDRFEATIISTAAGVGYISVLRDLINRGVRIDVHDEDHETALYRACMSNSTEAALLLLEAGADPSVINPSVEPVLMLAIQHNNAELVKALVEAGEDPHAREMDEPLWKLALELEYHDLLPILLSTPPRAGNAPAYANT